MDDYMFYRIIEETIYIVDIFHEREDFIRKLFEMQTTHQETED